MTKFDLHTHHERCGHADGAIEEYIQAAIKCDLQVIGISDHSPYFAHDDDQPFPKIAMPRSDFPNYVEQVLSLKQKYKDKIQVLLSVESDYFPQHFEIYRRELEKYPFDYIIGSVHQVNGVSIFNRNRWKGLSEKQRIEQKETYYDLIAQSAKTGLFQVLGHIDAMKGYYPAFSDIPAYEKIENTLKIIAQNNVSIEVNTSGGTKDVGGWYPSKEILERAHFYGVKITFGSDSHTPSRIGEDFEKVAKLLKEIGYKSWVYYVDKKPVEVKL